MQSDEARILRCTVPLLVREGRRAPVLVGTAVALRIQRDRFLLTAGHVVDDFVGREFWLAHGGEIVPFACRAERNVTPGLERDDDTIDIGVLRIDDGHIPGLDSDCITPCDLHLREWQRPGRDGFLVGYPCSRYRTDASRRHIDLGHVRYWGDRLDEGQLLTIGRHSEVHAGLTYDPRATILEGRRVTPPKLQCASGAGVWDVPRLSDPRSLQYPRLIAICTDHVRESKCLVATRVAWHCELIRSSWPHTSNHLGTHGGLPISLRRFEAD